MCDQLLGESLSSLTVTEGIEVSPIEGKGSLISAGATACSEIKEVGGVIFRPLGGVSQSGPVVCNSPSSGHQIHVEGEEPQGNLAAPLSSLGCHSIQHDTTLFIRNSRNPVLLCSRVGQQLSFVSQRVQPASQPLVHRDVSNENAADLGAQGLRAEVSLDVGDECAIEVVHGDEDDCQIGLVQSHRFLEEPANHPGRVSGLSSIQDLDVGAAGLGEGLLSEGSDALVIGNSPAKNRGVSHDCHSEFVGAGLHRVRGSETVRVRGELKVMRLTEPLHLMVGQVCPDRPAASSVRPVRRRNSSQTRGDLRQAQQRCRKDQTKQELGNTGSGLLPHAAQLSRMLFVWFLMSLCLGTAMADVSVTLQVSTSEGAVKSEEPGSITAHLQWLGENIEVPLTQTQSGLWTATARGPQVRTLGIDLWLNDRIPSTRISQGLEVMPKGDATLSWSLAGRGENAAWRLSEPVQLSTMRAKQERSAMLGGAWAVLSVLFVLVLGGRALAARDLDTGEDKVSLKREGLAWFVFALVWTWPAAVAGSDIVGRHFDALGTVWVIDAVTRLGFDLHDPSSAWPTGATYSAIDSWLLLPMSWLGASLRATTVHGWIAVIGVATSGLSASMFARLMGARAPFHSVAGLLFIGSGLAAAALLEGHVYQVVNPWMPLMAIHLWRAGGHQRRGHHGLIAGLFFGLALFSSGYLGLSAGLVALGLALPLLVRGPRDGVLIAGVVAVLLGALYLYLFSAAGQPGATHATTETLRMGSLSLNSLGPATAEIDRTDHSWSIALSAMMVALAVLTLVSKHRGAGQLMGIASVSVLIAMGPDWSLGIAPDEATLASPIQFLWDLPSVRYLRFPGRILWAALLSLSVLAAVGLTFLAQRLGKRSGLLVMAIVVVEALVTVRLPARQVVMVSDTPQVYGMAEGPVFDLVGEGTSISREVDSWMNAILCQYQTVHSRPIAEDCVAVGPAVNPRVPLARWVAARLYEGDSQSVIGRLKQLGFTALAVHYDWIDAGDALRIKTALEGLSVHAEEETAEGVSLYVFDDQTQEAVQMPATSARIVGPPAVSVDWNMRVDLLVPDGFDAGRFFAVVDPYMSVELKDNAGLPGDQFGDGRYSGTWADTVEGEVRFRLIHVKAGETSVLWAGPVVPLAIGEDRLTFRVDEAGQAEPQLRALDIFSPEVRNKGGKIRGMAWLACLVLMGLWWFKMRREPGLSLARDTQ